MPASKGTMQKFNEPVRTAPCGSLTESGRLSSVCQHLLDPRLFDQNTKGAASALVRPEEALRGGVMVKEEKCLNNQSLLDVVIPAWTAATMAAASAEG